MNRVARVRCESCGPLQVPICDMVVMIHTDGGAHYAFRCVKCQLRSTGSLVHGGRLARALIDSLALSGAVVRPFVMPAELADNDRWLATDLCVDDVLDLHLALEACDCPNGEL